MNILARSATALAVTVALALFGSAGADAAKQLKKRPIQMDPALGYVLVRIGPTISERGRAPNLYLWRFDRARSEMRTTRRADPARVPRGEDSQAVLGARPFLAGEVGVFIASLTPGDWVIHGTETTCFCLGSYSFTVRPGEITDLGTVLLGREDGMSPVPELREQRLSGDLLDRDFVITDAMLVRPAADGDPLPPEVAGLTVTRAELTPDVRFPNRGPARLLYPGGLLINRASGLPAPVPGDGRAMVERVRAEGQGDVALQPPPAEQERRRRERAAQEAARRNQNR